MSTDAALRCSLDADRRAAQQVQDAARKLVVGKRVRVTSKFNGQPYGRSRPPLTGKILIIDSVFLDGSEVSFTGHHEDGSWLHAGFSLSDIEFLEE